MDNMDIDSGSMTPMQAKMARVRAAKANKKRTYEQVAPDPSQMEDVDDTPQPDTYYPPQKRVNRASQKQPGVYHKIPDLVLPPGPDQVEEEEEPPAKPTHVQSHTTSTTAPPPVDNQPSLWSRAARRVTSSETVKTLATAAIKTGVGVLATMLLARNRPATNNSNPYAASSFYL